MVIATILALVGFVGLIVGLIMIVINVIKKTPKKTSGIILGSSAALLIVGIAISSFINAPSQSETKVSETSKSKKNETLPSTEESSEEEIDYSDDSEILNDDSVDPEEVNIADYNTGITYDNLARTPDDHLGDKVTLSGEVAQVIEGGDYTQYRLAVDQDYDNMVLIQIPSELLTSRVLENDLITIYGESQGTTDYESTLGGNITVPAITVDKFEVTGQAE